MPTTTLTRKHPRTVGSKGARADHAVNTSLTTNRRSAPLAIAGIACMLFGGLAAVTVYLRINDSVSALIVTRNVAVGQVITESDLGVVELSADGLSHVAAADRSSATGRTAAVALPSGSLVTRAAMGEPLGLGSDEAVVGLALKPGQLPAGLRAGDSIAVVDTEARPATNGNGPQPATLTEEATVVSAATAATNGGTTISLRVPRRVADAITAAAAAGRVSLVLLPPAR